jgi:hypothetical protein
MVLRRIRFRTWEELKRAALEFEKKGVQCECRGWSDISLNILTVYGEWE